MCCVTATSLQQNMVQTFTLRTVFLVASMKVTDPNGQLDGDVLYVHAEPGYNNIAEMTNQMMSMVSHSTMKNMKRVLVGARTMKEN
jgi:hypothetical protein